MATDDFRTHERRASRQLIHRTKVGVEIFAAPGIKSLSDFVVTYREPGKRMRTPQHIHLIVDLFGKRTGHPALTDQFVDYVIGDIILAVTPATGFPPGLQVFHPGDAQTFEALDQYGEYTAEFLLVVTELIMIQEKTNYPTGTMNLRLFEKFRQGADIFSVVSAATFGGRRR